jgi:hypothetical protein
VNWSDVVVNVRAEGWRSVAGSRFELLLPVRQPLLDYLMEGVALPKALRRAHVTMKDGNRLSVRLTASLFGFTRDFELKLRLAPALEGRRVLVSIENQALLAAALAVIGPALTLPAGVTIEDARIVVNLDALAASRGAGDIMEQLAAATFAVNAGVLWIGATVEVHAVAATSVTPVKGPSAITRVTLPPDDELAALLAGAHAEWRLRVAEALANQLLGTAVQTLREQGASDAGRAAGVRRLLGALQSLEVHFEDGVVVLAGTASLANR